MLRSALALAAALALIACSPSAPSGTAPQATPPPAAPAVLTPEEIATRVAALPAPYSAGDYDHGKRIAAQCRSCHTLDASERNLVGPHLHGVFGRPAGSIAGFAYSGAVKGAGFTWDEAHLENWLKNPREFLPGNRMAFPGVPSDTDRRDLITFLHVETTR